MVAIPGYSTVAPAALNIQQQTGVPASIVLAVMTNEGGIGSNQSTLSSQYNNFFGIKSASNPPGSSGSVTMPTQEVIGGSTVTLNQGFAVFPDIQSGLAAFVNFLAANPRYNNLVTSSGHAVTTDPTQFARLLQQDGYGTDPNLGTKYASLAQSPAIQQALAAAGGSGSSGGGAATDTQLPGVTDTNPPADITGVIPGTTTVPGQVTGTASNQPTASGAQSSGSFSDSVLHLMVTIGLIVAAAFIALIGALFLMHHDDDNSSSGGGQGEQGERGKRGERGPAGPVGHAGEAGEASEAGGEAAEAAEVAAVA